MNVPLALLASLVAVSSATPGAEETTLCALVSKPEAFSGKLVRFRAGIITDWQHGTVLVHAGCKGGVELSSTHAVPSRQSNALDEAVGTPLDGGWDRTAMATFTGRFSFRPTKHKGAFANPFKFDAVRIQSVRSFRHNGNR